MTIYPLDDVLRYRLSLAVRPFDIFTMTTAVGVLEVTLRDEAVVPVRNLSGYYCFLDLNPGVYGLRVRGSARFLPAEHSVSIPRPDGLDPSVGVALPPSPAYPFPPGTTLVRGRLLRFADDSPVVDAEVSVIGQPLKSRTSPSGEYVLFFPSPLVGAAVTLRFEKDGNSALKPVTVTEGKTENAGTTFIS